MAVLALSSGDDEYTPYGRLFISIAIQLAFTFQGGRFSDGLELVLRGARHSRPVLGRFLTINRYLLINQDEIPPSLSQGMFTYLPIAAGSMLQTALARLGRCLSHYCRCNRWRHHGE
jgi:hypothetical protein